MNTNVDGLYYIPNYLTEEEHYNILQFFKNSDEWKHINNYKNSRRVIHYGYNYAYNRSGIKKIGKIPKFFIDLVNTERINNAIGFNLINSDMEQLIINEYKPGQGIANHIDNTKFFGPIILCLSVGSEIEIEFSNGNIKKNLCIEPKSLYIMTKDARYKWKHGIAKKIYNYNKDKLVKRSIRYSLTFRTICD